MELGRTQSQHYASQNSEGLLHMGGRCEKIIPGIIRQRVACKHDFDSHAAWGSNCKEDGTQLVSLEDIVIWATPYVAGSREWKWDQIKGGEAPYFWPRVFRKAANLYGNQ